MWELNDKSRSKITPRFLTVALEAKVMPSRVAISLESESLRFLGPSIRISVFSEFNIRKLQLIQDFMSLRHVCNLDN